MGTNGNGHGATKLQQWIIAALFAALLAANALLQTDNRARLTRIEDSIEAARVATIQNANRVGQTEAAVGIHSAQLTIVERDLTRVEAWVREIDLIVRSRP